VLGPLATGSPVRDHDRRTARAFPHPHHGQHGCNHHGKRNNALHTVLSFVFNINMLASLD
jgi:hypothetical protein